MASSWRRFAPFAVLEDLTSHQHPLYFGCAFIDAERTDVAVQSFNHLADADAARPMKLERAVDHFLGQFGGPELGHRCDPGHAPWPGVTLPGGAEREQCGRVDVGGHVAQHGLRQWLRT